MSYKKRAKKVTINDAEAIPLVNERAVREHRSCAKAGALTIIEALSNKKENTDPK
jgi:hypothetical protein